MKSSVSKTTTKRNNNKFNQHTHTPGWEEGTPDTNTCGFRLFFTPEAHVWVQHVGSEYLPQPLCHTHPENFILRSGAVICASLRERPVSHMAGASEPILKSMVPGWFKQWDQAWRAQMKEERVRLATGLN